MRRTLLLAAATASFLCSAAQKYDRENLSYNNTHIPSKLIYDQIKTYGYQVNMFGGDPSALSTSEVENMGYKFHSFDRVDASTADMRIGYTVGPFGYVGEKTVTREVEEEVNKQKVKVTKYKRVYEFRYPVRTEVVNRKNNVRLFVSETGEVGTLSVESSEFSSESQAVDYFDKTKGEMIRNSIRNHVGSIIKSVNRSLADQYDFYPSSTLLNVFQFKKWDRDDEYNKQVDRVKEVIKYMTAGESPLPYREKLNEQIAYFQQFEGVFKPDDKKEDILYFGNYMNLATIFFCLDDMDKATFYLDKLDSSDKKEGMTKMLRSYINSARNRMNKHLLASTHLDYNPVKDYRLGDKKFMSDALSAAENLLQGLGAEGIAKANDVVRFTNGTSLKGKVIYYPEQNAIKLLPAHKPDSAVVLNPENTIAFAMDTLNFVSGKHKYNGPVVKQFFKVTYQSQKISLLSAMNAALAETGSYGTIRPNEELVTIWAGFGLKKSLGSYFEDCSAVAKKAKDGEYGGAMSAEVKKYIRMCEEYTAECGGNSSTAGTN